MGFMAATGDGSRESHQPALDLFLLQEEVKPGDSRCYQIDINAATASLRALFEKLLTKTICSLSQQKQTGKIQQHQENPYTSNPATDQDGA